MNSLTQDVMETIDTIKQLLAYNQWANRRVLDSLKDPANHHPKAVQAFAHLLLAEKMWLARLLKNVDNTGFNFWPATSLDECAALAEENQRAFAALFDKLTKANLESVATYKNSKGTEYQTSHRDIFTHVFLHSTYHRGQVAMTVRAEGGTPAYTDYIAFVRERADGK